MRGNYYDEGGMTPADVGRNAVMASLLYDIRSPSQRKVEAVDRRQEQVENEKWKACQLQKIFLLQLRPPSQHRHCLFNRTKIVSSVIRDGRQIRLGAGLHHHRTSADKKKEILK